MDVVKFKHYKEYNTFQSEKDLVEDGDIVFVLDLRKIYTHGLEYKTVTWNRLPSIITSKFDSLLYTPNNDCINKDWPYKVSYNNLDIDVLSGVAIGLFPEGGTNLQYNGVLSINGTPKDKIILGCYKKGTNAGNDLSGTISCTEQLLSINLNSVAGNYDGYGATMRILLYNILEFPNSGVININIKVNLDIMEEGINESLHLVILKSIKK